MSPDEIQKHLSELFCPPLDTTLVAAIAYEPGQTLQSAKEVCETLAAAAVPDFDERPSQNPPSPPPPTRSNKQRPEVKQAGASARRKAFGGKLTNGDGSSSNDTTAASTETATHQSASMSASSTPSLGSQSTAADAETVERLLSEWSLVDRTINNPENLHLTDEESSSDTESSMPGHHALSSSISASSKLLDHETSEAARVGELSGSHRVDPTSVAAGKTDLSSTREPKDAFNPIEFLKHAFPARTVEFLRETLSDSHGDVQTAVDTVMTIDLIEAEDARAATSSQLDSNHHHQHHQDGQKGGGLDYEALSGDYSSLNGKKRRAARKRLQHEQKAAGKVKVNLTDVRHGAATGHTVLRKIQDQTSQKSSRTSSPLPQLTDAELAAKLAAQEEEAARDPDADKAVSDNQWLLTSSVLSQLSTLLGIAPTKVTAVYNASSFNLANCMARLLEQECDKYPSLSSLDEAGGAPSGTAESIADGIASISGVLPKSAARALRATKGRQDAALDLLQLQKLVAQEVGEADALDPIGLARELGPAEVPRSAEVSAKGYAIDAGAAEGKFACIFPTPSQAALAKAGPSVSGGVYSNVVGRRSAGPAVGAAAALRSGSAVASVLPASFAFVDGQDDDMMDDPVAVEKGLAAHTAHYDPTRRMAEYRLIADEYRVRRDEALRKAASAWKSQRGGVRSGGKGGDGGRGGIAWHYADEARRLDAKSRAWSLRASQALVEDRRRAAIGVVRTPSISTASHTAATNSIDLHGVTMHEALSIVREHVTRWYATPTTASATPPFRIVTGVGRHSPHQIAVLRPAIAKMLDREGWRFDVDHHRGIITVRGAK